MAEKVEAGSIDTSSATARHTPGPWEVSHYYSEDGNFAVGSRQHRYLALTQTPVTDALDLDKHQERANAHLIAAAPELLELAYAVAEHFRDTDAPLGAAARAAIAKAEGKD